MACSSSFCLRLPFSQHPLIFGREPALCPFSYDFSQLPLLKNRYMHKISESHLPKILPSLGNLERGLFQLDCLPKIVDLVILCCATSFTARYFPTFDEICIKTVVELTFTTDIWNAPRYHNAIILFAVPSFLLISPTFDRRIATFPAG